MTWECYNFLQLVVGGFNPSEKINIKMGMESSPNEPRKKTASLSIESWLFNDGVLISWFMT